MNSGFEKFENHKFENYKTELDKMRLTDESKKNLAASLARRGAKTGTPNHRRFSGAVRLAALLAAAVCLATAGYAAAAASPTLRDSVFAGGAAYEQSSSFIGRSVDNQGWTATITDCVGDDYYLYLGLDLTAPEGTVLDADWYCFGDLAEYVLKFSDFRNSAGQKIWQLPDEDPTDNRVSFVITASALFEKDGHFNNQKMRLRLPELRTGRLNLETLDHEYTTIKSGKWDFGNITLDYPDSTIRLTLNLPVTTLGVEAVITELAVSPLSVSVRIEGDALKGHHSWVPKNARDGWYSCIDYQEIVLHFDDGTAFTVDQADSNVAGSLCTGGDDPSKDGLLVLRRTYSANINGVSDRLVDVDRVVSVSVCGVEIPLR